MSTAKTKSEVAEKVRAKEFIQIKGARANNLKNISLDIPKNKLIVFTGLSGSGKSSITMDTLFAEGQRRYVESLSSYARQFLMRMKKPEVDVIKGICPAIAIEQKVSTRNARSTVGTLTEVYDFFRLLFARVGKTYSPISGKVVKRHQVSDVVDFLMEQEEDAKAQLFIPLNKKYKERTVRKELDLYLQKGYSRMLLDGDLVWIEEFLEAGDGFDLETVEQDIKSKFLILVDRFAVRKDDEENTKRISDSVRTCFVESEGECVVDIIDAGRKSFNNRFELDGMEFLENTPQLFNYNNPYGACPKCEGFGKVMGIDENKVIADPSKSIYEGAVGCWRGEKNGRMLQRFLENAHKFDFPVHEPFENLTKEQKKLIWTGNEHFRGVNAFFKELESKSYKIQNRVMLARYRGRTTCHVCDGGRLRKEASYVKINGKTIPDLVDIPVNELVKFFDNIELNKTEEQIGKRLLLEIKNRLDFMINVGLGYLTIGRVSSTLSGGETQRLNLTRTLGSNLTASMYILDEPSIGLHPRDTSRLVKVLYALRDLGNTVIVVEHEEDIMRASDYLVDVGPKAGIEGGEIVFAGDFESIYEEASESLTTKYLTGKMKIPVPKHRREGLSQIFIKGAKENNLRNIDATIPLNVFTVVTGVSGSGKTTLIKQILYPAMLQKLGEPYTKGIGRFNSLEGDFSKITQVEMVNQNPIGKSSRSNPVTYVKAYDAIRGLMANQQLAKLRAFKPKHFSFNVDGGRCETCKGEGEQVVEMQFLADIRLECEACKGKRFQKEVLDVQYKGKDISDILGLSIDEALVFFEGNREIVQKIKPLQDVGLGYIKLGQSSSTLSGGEAQRVKLASFLVRESKNERILFIFDEPTTGLHFHDIQKLLDAMNALIDRGHTIVVIEHNMEVIKSADWVIDLGPDGGKDGGALVYQGKPEELIHVKGSYTGKYLAKSL
ncbi:MAG: excinuclease ABC subunit UvrA [Saprospiraceae bacterium]|nr:excinuclease ABC subunit UvrA [Saprospiraceae bacterium]